MALCLGRIRTGAPFHCKPILAGVDAVLDDVVQRFGQLLVAADDRISFGVDVLFAAIGAPRDVDGGVGASAYHNGLHIGRRLWRDRLGAGDGDLPFLPPIGEVVVARRHVLEGALLHSEKPEVDGRGGAVQLLAIGLLLVVVDVARGSTGGLLDQSELLDELFFRARARELRVLSLQVDLVLDIEHTGCSRPEWQAEALVIDLDDVVPISPVGAFAVVVSVVVGVVVACPLDVDVVVLPHDEVGRVEVVFGCRVRLHDVAALALHVEIVDVRARRHLGGPILDGK
mmetsp:Transcript_22146/g.50913  ORF Transcript_22146/g.50913 Transcript_22146/m.50913 type:complete len:285 (-) Transcript_22146:1274-2128(-)